MMPKPPYTGAAGAGAVAATGGAAGLGVAEATPVPLNAANAAITVMIAMDRLAEVFLAISLSLSLSALCA